MAQGNWTVEFFSESPTSCMVCFQKANELTLSLPMQIDQFRDDQPLWLSIPAV
jgi:hypothetical protein